MKKILDTVTLSGHVFAMLEKWVSDLGDEELFVTPDESQGRIKRHGRT